MQAAQLIWLKKQHKKIGLLLFVPALLWLITGVLHPLMSAIQPQPKHKNLPSTALFAAQFENNLIASHNSNKIPQNHLNQTTANVNEPWADATAQKMANSLHQASDFLATQNIKSMNALQFLNVNNQLLLQIQTSQNNNKHMYWFNTQNAQLMPDADQHYAQQLAAGYLSLPPSRILKTQKIDQFNSDYPYVNRILPVWQVSFDNGLRAYIDTQKGQLTSLSNNQRLYLAQLFQFGHTFKWLNAIGDTAKNVLLSLALLVLGALTITGIVLGIQLKNTQGKRLQKQPAKRWHRRLSLGLAIFALFWVCSGAYHLLHEKTKLPPVVFEVNPQQLLAAQPLKNSLKSILLKQEHLQNVNSLQLEPFAVGEVNLPHTALSLSTQNQSPKPTLSQHQSQNTWVWQVVGINPTINTNKTHKDNNSKHSPNTVPSLAYYGLNGVLLPNGLQQHMQQLGHAYTQLPLSHIKPVQWITQFGGEYGFVNKRLPVYQVNTLRRDDLTVYIDPTTGVLAAAVANNDRLEGQVFSTIHKWSWLPVSKPIRDLMLSAVALLLLIALALGLKLSMNKRTDSTKAKI